MLTLSYEYKASGRSSSRTLIDKMDLLEWHGERSLSLVLAHADLVVTCSLAVAYSTSLSLYADSAQRYNNLSDISTS